MDNIGARSVAAAVALERLGLHLLVSQSDFLITDKPDGPEGAGIRCETIDQVEEWIADHRPTARPAKPIEPRRPRVGDPVHYVSHGSPVRADGTQAYKSVCRAAIVTEVYDMDPVPEHGVPYVGLFVINPTGTFHDQGTRFDPGTLASPGRETSFGQPLPPVTCDDLTFEGGTWHWAGDQ